MLRNFGRLSLRFIHSATFSGVDGLTSKTRCTTNIMMYSKYTSRKPIAITNEDELFDNNNDDDKQTNLTKSLRKRGSKIRKEKARKEAREKKKLEERKEEESDSKKPLYKALKENDKLISSLMLKIRTRKNREKHGQILLEGFRIIQDAIQGGAIPRVIFFSRLDDVQRLSFPQNVQLYKIPYRTIQLWSTLTTSPGILGIFNIPNMENKEPTEDAIPLTIICDNIREPGNLGSIVRTAAAVGCEKLILMKGCVDLWEPKVLRGATGAHFRIPIHTSISWEDLPALISNESTIYLADNNMEYKRNDSDEAEMNLTDVEEDDSKDQSERNDPTIPSEIKSYTSTAKTKALVKKIVSQFPIVPYHTLDFTKTEIVLITGGETEGVSLQSCDLLRQRDCTRVNISLTSGIESLNIASALSIIAFEMKRQFIIRTINNE
ncbi:PREDICTED: rRNA methyltransferase 3, mitochondrial [Dinoponera quadriceps]|uniref:rRNA methyltransferase 3, mitochondrial n=1 Tax=Dinoponera quadriceps TaxID=609295 RepID=A0A6P3X6I0_DINQU|nr:PREDICTED: rRNA methyltransferase 3, mitochondrial [Dinoponera quadriceps]